MNFAMTTILSTLAIALVVIPLLTAIAFANSSNSTNSNHVKWCKKQKDKETRSIMCPDVFPKSETTIKLYG